MADAAIELDEEGERLMGHIRDAIGARYAELTDAAWQPVPLDHVSVESVLELAVHPCLGVAEDVFDQAAMSESASREKCLLQTRGSRQPSLYGAGDPVDHLRRATASAEVQDGVLHPGPGWQGSLAQLPDLVALAMEVDPGAVSHPPGMGNQDLDGQGLAIGKAVENGRGQAGQHGPWPAEEESGPSPC